MKTKGTPVAALLLAASAFHANAQTVSPAWDAYQKQSQQAQQGYQQQQAQYQQLTPQQKALLQASCTGSSSDAQRPECNQHINDKPGQTSSSTWSDSGQAAGIYAAIEGGRSHDKLKVKGEGSTSDNDTTYSGWLGYDFNQWIGVEAHYGSYYDKTEDDLNYKLTGYGLGLRLKATFPDADNFFAFTRFGWESDKLSLSARGDLANELQEAVGATSTSGKDNSAFYVGAGLGYNFTPHAAVTLDYDYHHASRDGVAATVSAITLGLEYKF